MSFPTYQLNIWEVATNTLKEIVPVSETFNLTFSRALTDIGVIAFTMSEKDRDIRGLFADDNIIDVKRQDPSGALITEESYLVRNFDRVTAEDGLRAIIGGLSLNSLLQRRLIDPADDSVQPNGGYATKAGDAAQVIRAYVRDQLGDLASNPRKAPRFTVPLWPDSGTTVGANLRYQNLWKEIRKLALSGNTDLQIVHDGNGNLELEIQTIGDDKSVTTQITPPYLVFSPDRGNIRNPSVKIDRKKESNALYVLGEGEGANRTEIQIITAASGDTIYNRIEKTVDVRNSDKGDNQTLRTEGIQRSIEFAAKIEFEFEIIPNAGGSEYRTDWFLGDIGTFIWDDIRYDRRIIGFDVKLNQSGEKMSVKFGELS